MRGGQCVQVLVQTHLHLAICRDQTINPGRQWPIVQAPQKPMSCSYLESTTAAKFFPPSHSHYIQCCYHHALQTWNSNSFEGWQISVNPKIRCIIRFLGFEKFDESKNFGESKNSKNQKNLVNQNFSIIGCFGKLEILKHRKIRRSKKLDESKLQFQN